MSYLPDGVPNGSAGFPQAGFTASARALRRAIAHREFVLHYQPQVRLSDGAITGHEALVRWQHPTAGLLQPAVFVPYAEALGVMPALDDLVLQGALADFAEGRLDGGEVSVNCSATSVDAGIASRVDGALRRAGVQASALVMEITESLPLRPGPVVDCAVGELVEAGVTLAMDDFGVGAGRMSSMIDIPYARLKIDRSLTGKLVLQHSARAAAFTQGVVALAARMDVTVVAEGVETPAQAAAARSAGIEFAQGFHFGRPAPAGTGAA